MFKGIDIKFVNKEIAPFGGLSLFFKMLEKCGFEQELQACGLPEQGSNRGCKPWQLIYGLFAGVWCGACKFGHLDLVRYDRVLSKMVGWNIGAGHRSYQRYLDKFTQAPTKGFSGICTNGFSTTSFSTITRWTLIPRSWCVRASRKVRPKDTTPSVRDATHTIR